MAFVTSHTLVKSALRQAEKDNYMTETLDNKNILFLYGKLLTIVSFQRIETRLITQRIHHWWQINSIIILPPYACSSSALAAEKIANDHNLQLTDPLTRTTVYPVDDQFQFDRVSVTDVQRIVSDMPLNKSPGINYIPTRVLYLKIAYLSSYRD
jgi:hypothetical protein